MACITIVPLKRRPLMGWMGAWIPRGVRHPNLLLAALWILGMAVLALVPEPMVKRLAEQESRVFWLEAYRHAQKVADAWARPFEGPRFERGDEPVLRAALESDPLLAALVDPARRQVWLREGGCLRLLRTRREAEPWLEAVRRAGEEGRTTWVAPCLEGDASMLALPGATWWTLRRWRPGSPEVERFLQALPRSRGWTRFGPVLREGHGAVPLPLDSLQMPDPPGSTILRLKRHAPLFHERWIPTIGPSHLRTWLSRRQEQHRRRIAWVVYGAVAAASLTAVLLYRRSRHRERLEADRLASLTHSLKTPLTVLKLRCETARNPHLPLEARNDHLVAIGEEVDQLMLLIESGLEDLRPRKAPGCQEVQDERLFDRVEGDLLPAFQDESRALVRTTFQGPFRGQGRALHSALSTLLENALLHGRGTVAFRGERRRRSILLSVTDEGSGIAIEALQLLKDSRQPGPPREGARQGLGLFLLTQLASREGWGLRFERVEGGGFMAELEVPQ